VKDFVGQPELSTDAAITAVAVLDDEFRRGMYDFIRAARRPVTREQAAEAVGISTKLAAFHLDKMVRAGLLRSYYARTGALRKVGRTPTVYEPIDEDVRISLPARQHGVLAAILIEAVTTQGERESTREAIARVAREHGQALAAAASAQRRPGRLGAERAITISETLLAERGYQPDRLAPGDLRLRNCPFHPMAAREPELVCGLNHAFLTGLIDGLDAPSVSAVLEPYPGECCVRLRSTRQA
jgi:predicted ArsR family transcriptional regulator